MESFCSRTFDLPHVTLVKYDSFINWTLIIAVGVSPIVAVGRHNCPSFRYHHMGLTGTRLAYFFNILKLAMNEST